jgi:hypothetical protein
MRHNDCGETLFCYVGNTTVCCYSAFLYAACAAFRGYLLPLCSNSAGRLWDYVQLIFAASILQLKLCKTLFLGSNDACHVCLMCCALCSFASVCRLRVSWGKNLMQPSCSRILCELG